jgi:hypothetical protein
MDGWKQNDWRKADGAPVRNKVSQNLELGTVLLLLKKLFA